MPNFQEGVETLMELQLVGQVLSAVAESSDGSPEELETFDRLLQEHETAEERAEHLYYEVDEDLFHAMSHEAKVRANALAGELLSWQGINND